MGPPVWGAKQDPGLLKKLVARLDATDDELAGGDDLADDVPTSDQPECEDTDGPLLELPQPLHVLVLQKVDGREVLLSSLLVEWRKVLFGGRCNLAVELPGVGDQAKLPVGSLELRFELLPSLAPDAKLAEEEVVQRLQTERNAQVDTKMHP